MTEAEQNITDYSDTPELDEPNDPRGEKFILFEVANRVCGVAARSVLEVVHSLPVSAIPNSPSWLLGLSIFRGEPVAMVRPEAFVKEAESGGDAARNFKTIVFRGRDEEAQLAFPVDRIKEMITIPNEERSGGHDSEQVHGHDASLLLLDPYSLIAGLNKGEC